MDRQVRALPVVQHRSQQTRDRLLDAAEALLREGGPEASTVPAIAERAGVAVGSVYRRFANKDAVLRSIYERFFARSSAGNREALRQEHWEGVPLRKIVERLVAGMVHGYKFHSALLAGLLRYVDAHPEIEFRKQAEGMRHAVFADVSRLLLSRRSEITHPDPERAVEFVLITLGLTLRGFLLNGDRLHREVSWQELSDELQRMMIAYLCERRG